jgi:hypothetical protein
MAETVLRSDRMLLTVDSGDEKSCQILADNALFPEKMESTGNLARLLLLHCLQDGGASAPRRFLEVHE